MEFELNGDEPVSLAIIRGVAVAENTRPEDLPELYGVIDPDALDELVSPDNRESAFEGNVSFSYSNSYVVVRCTPSITISIR
jgi:hypothetical protein